MSSQDDDDASSKPRIDPEDNPRLAKALAKLSENLKEGEDPLYYDWRKSGEAGPQNKLQSDGDEAASGYVAAKTLPPTVAHKTIEMQRVKIAPHLDPRNAPTQPRLKVGPDAGADRPAPIDESSAAGASAASAASTVGAASAASAPASTPPPDGSRTVGGRTARLSPGVAPPPDETPPPSAQAHPGPPSDRTLGGRTARLKTVGEGAVPIGEPGADPSASLEDPLSDAAGGIPRSPAPSSVAPAARPPSSRPDAPGAGAGRTERPWLGIAIVAAAVLVVAVIAVTQMGKGNDAPANAAGTSTARTPEPGTAAHAP